MIKISHILIGCPGSGKSTIANKLVNQDKRYRIVSTDKIRQKLFGDETIQGDWQLIEAEVLSQIQQHLAAGNLIIYDATNAKRPWRMDLLQKLKQYGDIQWIGWELQTPLGVCKHWNQQRERQVSEEIIEKMYHSLKQFPPLAAEGFTTVYSIPYTRDSLDTNHIQTKITSLSRTIVNRKNRTQNRKVELHTYSRLLDFDRLMHLISLMIHYPGVGNLQKTEPQLLKQILGETVNFETSVDEICVLLAQHSNPIYADYQAIQKDLAWLELNGIIGDNRSNSDIQLDPIDDPDLVTHPYSDIEPFKRLIKTIRCIIHHPLLYNPEQGSLQTLVSEMEAQQVIDFNCANSVRKDIEKVLKPFGILPDLTMKRGYFVGTGILSELDLINVFRLLEAQAKSLEDPVSLEVYQRFRERMGYAQMAASQVYPVRAIYNRTIVDLETLLSSSLAHRIDEVERAIEEGRLLELKRLPGGGRFNSDRDEFFLAFPLQIVFHNIGWYLGFEYFGGSQSGLFRFERLDRLFLGREQQQKRDRSAQENALKKLITLYQCSGGIFLGNDRNEQHAYLSQDKSQKAQVQVTIELWFNDPIFRFISEGTKRFPSKQMRMSPRVGELQEKKKKPPFTLQQTEDPVFRNRFQVTLPKWCLEDVDLLRWIIGFGGQVKVVNSPELVEKVKEMGNAITKIYSVSK
jgi:predicted kinase